MNEPIQSISQKSVSKKSGLSSSLLDSATPNRFSSRAFGGRDLAMIGAFTLISLVSPSFASAQSAVGSSDAPVGLVAPGTLNKTLDTMRIGVSYPLPGFSIVLVSISNGYAIFSLHSPDGKPIPNPDGTPMLVGLPESGTEQHKINNITYEFHCRRINPASAGSSGKGKKKAPPEEASVKLSISN